jgi:glycine cleavage system pyridoxal-binding protein P
MAKTSEPELGRAMMLVLAGEPNGEATVRTLIKKLPDHIALTPEDHEQSDTRPNEEMWEQRVRNSKSHDKTPGNVIGEGYVEHVRRGWYRLTDAGRKRLGLSS